MVDYQSLFGATSRCECAHCRSVNGPAAYLVDILQFLTDQQRSVLFDPGRRPDLQHLPLTCENTDTLVPQLDLVNEVLERAVGTNPQQTLAQAVYGWRLPFDQPTAEARAFLDQLGVPRPALMAAFQRAGQPTDAAVAAESLGLTGFEWRLISGADTRPLWELWGLTSSWLAAGELQNVGFLLARSGLSYQDLVALLETRFVNADPSRLLTIRFAGAANPCDVAAATFERPLAAQDADRMHRFTRLLRATGWTARELDAAIAAFGAIGDDLLLAVAQVNELRARGGVSVEEALAIWAPIDAHGDDSLYQRLFQNPQVYAPVDTAFALQNGDIDVVIADHTPALLAALGLDAADLAALLAAELPAATRLRLAGLSQLFRCVTLARALDLTVTDFLALRSITGINPFDAQHVADTGRFAALADKVRASRTSFAQLVYLYRHLPDPSPFAPSGDAARELARALRDGLRKIDDETAAAPDATGELTRRKLGLLWKGEVADQMVALLIGTASYTARTAGLVDAPAVTFPDELAGRITWDAAAQALRFTGVMTEAERATLEALAGGDPALDAYVGAIDDLYRQPRAFLADTAAVFLDLADAQQQLLDDGVLTVEQKLAYFLAALLPYLRRTLGERLVKQTLAAALPLGVALVDLLLGGSLADTLSKALALAAPAALTADAQARWTGVLTVPFNETYTFYPPANGAVLLRIDGQYATSPLFLAAGRLHDVELTYDQSLAGATLDAPRLPRWSSPSTPREPIPAANLLPRGVLDDFLARYRLLDKAAQLINGLQLTGKEVAWISSHGADIGGFDWSKLPLAPAPLDAALLAQWERLADLVAFRRAFSPRAVEPVEVFAAATLTDATALLAAATGWDPVTLAALVAGFQLTAADLQDEIWLPRLRACMRLLAQLGVAPAEAFSWASTPPTADQSRDIQRAAKAKHTAETWPAVVKPVEDGLRGKKAAALVGWLLTKDPGRRFSDTNDLFDHFLIDVEMDACMSTSRLKQAIGSVQLFVQRALMNLEPAVTLSPEQARHWTQWMSRYRVWEANRKIFLYPENWIEPELRDDKTPFFRDLENELLQADLTPEAAEDAFRHYLESLHEVARLQIAALYEETGRADGARVLHVVGRTWHVPHAYSYRRREQRGDAVVWTPWEKVTADIEGDHLIAVVWNRRLHLFWPLFSVKQDPPTKAQRDAGVDPPRHMEIRLAWSELRNGAWTPKRLTPVDQCLRFGPRGSDDVGDFFLDRDAYTFKVTGDLVIQCIHADYVMVAPTPPPVVPPPPPTRFQGELQMGEAVRSADGRVSLSLRLVKENMPVAPDEGVLVLEGQGLELWKPPIRGRTVIAVHMQLWDDGNFVVDLGPPPPLEDFRWDTSFQRSPWVTNTNGHPGAYMEIHDDGALEIHDPNGLLLWSSLAPENGGRTLEILPSPPPPQQAPATPVASGVRVGEIQLTGCGGGVKIAQAFTHRDAALLLPQRSGLQDIALRETDTPGDSLYLLREDENENEVLRRTPGAFRVPFSAQYPEFLSQGHFFFEDEQKTFLVELEDQPAGDLGELTLAYPEKAEQLAMAMPYALNAQAAAVPEYLLADASPSMGDIVSLRWSDSRETTDQDVQDTRRVIDYLDERRYAFEVFYHPYACEALQELERAGLDALLAWPMTPSPFRTQPEPRRFGFEPGDFSFRQRYDVDAAAEMVRTPYPRELLDFATEGSTPYSQYNWELFFHAPLLIATQLGKRQRFAAAQKWFHYIFDPTDRSPYTAEPAHFWKFRRFYDDAFAGAPETIDQLLQDGRELGKQVPAWREHPFAPHLLARTRLAAYQKNVVMKYIDNLIAWGDQLFRQETIEALNEATQLYVLAAEILGERPATIPSPVTTADNLSYADLTNLDAFSNDLVQVENLLQDDLGGASSDTGWRVVVSLAKHAELFCIPGNDQLLQCWDTVADRLFKLRHCMNLEGVTRELPLFEPPIDPALLVRAAAAGVDLDTVLNDINTPLPCYRFTAMAQKANELCADVKVLGASLLAALEKKDAEELAQLRAGHEVDLLKAIRDVKQKQVDEAKEALAALNRYQEVVQARLSYYASRTYLNAYETAHMALSTASLGVLAGQLGAEVVAAILHLIPDTKAGAPTTIGLTIGGSNIASGIQAFGAAMGVTSSMLNNAGSLSAALGGFERRMDDWKHQAELATRELKQVERQIAGAELRVAVSENELGNHDRQIEQSRATDELIRAKFTNRDLHMWMAGQLSALYFQAYQLAYDVARRAERAYQFERADYEARFIEFGAWDGLKKGLLAGERLHQDLRRMEVAYLEQNRREYEISKHVSLLDLDAGALVALRETGTCFVDLPEPLFDADYPGHFLRRLKTVSLTIPCVAGPYDSVNCTLTLLRNAVRIDPKPGAGNPPATTYPRNDKQGPDPRFRDSVGAVQSIVTSHGQNDGGQFELAFRDERYLPFEGAGAISQWRLSLSPEHNRFDFSTITDVVLHLKYTAREGGEILRAAAAGALAALVADKARTPLVHVFSARREFGDDWHRFLHPADQTTQSLDLDLTAALPRQPANHGVAITHVDFFLETSAPITQQIDIDLSQRMPNGQDAPLPSLTLAPSTMSAIYHGTITLPQPEPPRPWTLRPTMDLPTSSLTDLYIACRYIRTP